MKTIIAIISLMIGFSSNLLADTQTLFIDMQRKLILQDYYPVQIGNKWVYERGDQVGFDVYEIIDTTFINDKCYYKFENRSTVRKEIYYFYRRMDSLFQILEPIHESNEEYIRYKLNVDPGTFWLQYLDQFTYKTTLEDTSRSVITPIGIFNSCYYYSILIIELHTDFKEWLAPGIGLIRDESEGQSRILVGASISGKIIGDTTVTEISEQTNLNQPLEFELEQNYPNPFNATTVIEYHTSKITNVELKIFNLLGKKLFHEIQQEQNPGNHKFVLNAEDWASGIYFYQVKTKTFTQTKKMLLIE